MAIAVLSYALQALALAFAPLSVVQPLLVSELLFAVPVAARWRHHRLRLREWSGVAAVGLGLTVALVAADPQPGNPLASPLDWAPVLGALCVVIVVSLLIGRSRSGPSRASLFALAAAAAMAAEAALMAATTRLFEQGIVTALTSWEPYAMATSSIVGLLLIQSAFQAGPLFGEQIRTAWPAVAAALLGLVALVAGIALLDTSPVVHSLHAEQNEPADPPGRAGADTDEPVGAFSGG
jgi:drug/metabolite transporter (DMT)-like permease